MQKHRSGFKVLIVKNYFEINKTGTWIIII